MRQVEFDPDGEIIPDTFKEDMTWQETAAMYLVFALIWGIVIGLGILAVWAA